MSRKVWGICSAALLVALCIAGCATTAAAPQQGMIATPVPTVQYRPPIVVTATPNPHPTALPTATPTQKPTPRPPAPTATPIPGPAPEGGVPNISGQLILVSIDQQWLWVYQDRHLIYATPVTTGMPQLPTPTGIYHILWRLADVTFISPWPPGSPYYYSPEYINHALYFLDGGYYIHDASWRHYFGPGTEVPHTNPDGTTETGSHGCVETSVAASTWLYDHEQNGATIDIYGTTPGSITPTAIPPTATPTDTPTTSPTDTPTP